ncbi:MAG: Stp1/IreP family PP2C-type Ser/Thr phosphatase [Cellulosilyticaceae bacterium]
MIAVGKIDIGIKRTRNEDGVFISNTPIGALPNLYIVADGMGGHKGGAVASKLAIEAFCAYIEAHNKIKFDYEEDILNLLKRGIVHANYIIYREANNHEECKGMGTTLTLCTVINNKIYSAHVGDTRIYLVNNSHIRQMTIDHSLVQEMVEQGFILESEVKEHPQRHVITRAVGTYENIKVDTLISELEGVEYILLCSDGLTSMISNEKIQMLIYSEQNNLNDIVERLIDAANAEGGLDNIAVIMGKRCEVIR